MNEELRERLEAAVLSTDSYGARIKRSSATTIVDAVLTEIEAAGFVIVPADRWERVRRVAEWAVTTPAIPYDVARPITLPGDLDGDV